MTDTQQSTFGEVLGRDLGEIKRDLSTVINKANTPSTVDTKLRDLLLTRRDSFLEWLQEILNDQDHILTTQDKDLINRSLFDSDIISSLEKEKIKPLLSRFEGLLTHVIISTYFEDEMFKYLDEKYSKSNVFDLFSLQKKTIRDSINLQGSTYPLSLCEWFISKVGFRRWNEAMREVIMENAAGIASRKDLFRIFFYFSAIQQISDSESFLRLVKENPEIVKNIPAKQRFSTPFADNNSAGIKLEEIAGVKETITSSPAYYLHYDYKSSSNYTYSDRFSRKSKYPALPISEFLKMFDLDDVSFQRIFDINYLYSDRYFYPLLAQFAPNSPYGQIMDTLFRANKNQPITSFKKLYEVTSTLNQGSESPGDHIKYQLEALPELLKYLKNGSEKFDKIRNLFKEDENKPNLLGNLNTIFTDNEISAGLGIMFLYMMDSDEFTDFFSLIVNLPGSEQCLRSALNSYYSGVSAYLAIPWIATNKTDKLAPYLSQLDKNSLFSTLKQNYDSGDFNYFGLQLQVMKSVESGTILSNEIVTKVRSIKNYKQKFLGNLNKIESLIQGLVDSVILTAPEKEQLNKLIKTPMSASVLSKQAVNSLNFKDKISATDFINDVAKVLVKYGKLSTDRMDLDIVALATNQSLRFANADTIKNLAATAVPTLAKVKADTAHWKYVGFYGQDSVGSIVNDINNASNNGRKPIIVFFSLGTYNNKDVNQVASVIMAKNSATDTLSYNRSNADTCKRLMYGNTGDRPNSREKVEDSRYLSGFWFNDLLATEWGDAYIGVTIYEYIGGS